MMPLGPQAPDGGRFHSIELADLAMMEHPSTSGYVPSNTTSSAEQQLRTPVCDIDPALFMSQNARQGLSHVELEIDGHVSLADNESPMTEMFIEHLYSGTGDSKNTHQTQSICHICGTGVFRKADFMRHLILHTEEIVPQTFESLHIWDIIPRDNLTPRPEGRIFSCGCCWRVSGDRKAWLQHVQSDCKVFEPMGAGVGNFRWRWASSNQVIGLILTVMPIEQLIMGLDPAFTKYHSMEKVTFSIIIAAMEFYDPSPELVRLALDVLMKADIDAHVMSHGAEAISNLTAKGPAVPPRRNPVLTTAYSCEVLGCEVTCDDPSKLRGHMRRDHTLQHFCKRCARQFQHAKDVRRHHETVHADDPIVCPYCGKPYNRKDNYNRHLRTVHKHDALGRH